MLIIQGYFWFHHFLILINTRGPKEGVRLLRMWVGQKYNVTVWLISDDLIKTCIIAPMLWRKRRILKLIDIRPSVCPPVCLSVTKTLTWLISCEVLMKEHYWYLACMILVSSPFYRHHAVTLTFDLFVAALNLLVTWFLMHGYINKKINKARNIDVPYQIK